MVLFFSRGISLRIWEESGLLSREMALYERIQGHEGDIVFLTYGRKGEESYEDRLKVKVLWNRWHLPTDLFGFLAPFLYHSEMGRATLFKSNQINGWWTAGVAKLFYRKPLIVRCGYLLSNDQERKGYNRLRLFLVSLLERIAFLYADAAVVTTEQMRDEVIARHGISRDKIRVIPNSVDCDLFKPLPQVRKKKGRLGFVGRFSPEKNLLLLLQSIEGMEGVSLLLIGTGEMDPLLRAEAMEKNIDVTILGNLPNRDLPELLNTCEAFVLPSKWEGMPKALIEAMACGLAVIGTNVPGIRDLIVHGSTGLLCDSSISGLRCAITLLMGDELVRKRLGEQARTFVQERFSIDRAVRDELDLMRSLEGR